MSEVDDDSALRAEKKRKKKEKREREAAALISEEIVEDVGADEAAVKAAKKQKKKDKRERESASTPNADAATAPNADAAETPLEAEEVAAIEIKKTKKAKKISVESETSSVVKVVPAPSKAADGIQYNFYVEHTDVKARSSESVPALHLPVTQNQHYFYFTSFSV